MKLFAGLVASAAAGSYVTCNNASNGVEIKMTIDVADVQVATGPGADWAKNAGQTQWEKTFVPTADDTTEVTVGTDKFLKVTQVVDSEGCDKATVDGVEVCTSKGHQFTFTCKYPLAVQTISTVNDFTVSGSDTTDSASGTGTLNYALTVDASAAFQIGNTVTATITPESSGLVTATILSCEVKNSDLSSNNEVTIIDANLKPTCDLGVAITTGQGDSTLGFTWQSFKWSTTKVGTSDVVENQELTCSISLAKKPAAVSPQTCGSSGETVTFTKMNGRTCTGFTRQPRAHQFGVTADECETQCLQDSECVAFTTMPHLQQCHIHTECNKDSPYNPTAVLKIKDTSE